MHLSWLERTNTRGYEKLRFEPVEGVNVLIGSNGAGKTSILEAAAYLGLLKSFRGTPDDAIVMSGAAQAVIRGEFDGFPAADRCRSCCSQSTTATALQTESP